jgi:hypothetical protein
MNLERAEIKMLHNSKFQEFEVRLQRGRLAESFF